MEVKRDAGDAQFILKCKRIISNLHIHYGIYVSFLLIISLTSQKHNIVIIMIMCNYICI